MSSSGGSSDRDEGKSSTCPEDDILMKAAEFFMGEEFQSAIDGFVERNCPLFLDQANEYNPDEVWNEETDEFLEPGVTRLHTLEQHEAYERFQALFEEKLECFYERNGVSARGFMQQCKQAVADAEAGKETMGTVFVELMLATSEYEGFVTMMAREAEEQCPAPAQQITGAKSPPAAEVGRRK